jgi:hypothetical protein
MPETQTPEQVTLERLDSQINWYSSRSSKNQTLYKTFKALTIISAAMIPVLTTSNQIRFGSQIAAGLGVLIAILEGMQQLNKYHDNWTDYRATAEALKHEKFLYLAKAGPYRDIESPASRLAERVEALVSQEESNWVTLQTEKPKSSPSSSN